MWRISFLHPKNIASTRIFITSSFTGKFCNHVTEPTNTQQTTLYQYLTHYKLSKYFCNHVTSQKCNLVFNELVTFSFCNLVTKLQIKCNH